MTDFMKMAKAAKVYGGDIQPVNDGDSDQLKEMKKLPYYDVDFAKVEDAPIQKVGVYAKSEAEAIKQAAKVLEDFVNPPARSFGS